MTFYTDTYKESRTRQEVIIEAYCLLGWLDHGQSISHDAYERGDLHLSSLDAEFPELNASQMAHKLAERLQLNPRLNFWGRLRYLFMGSK